MGHASDMLGSRLSLRLSLKDVPLIEGVLGLADMGLIPEGTYRNRAAFEGRVTYEGSFGRAEIDALFDAQTSGGLLLAVAPERAEEMLRTCREAGFDRTAKIGVFVQGNGKIAVT
jgi:selenide,water dikinase